MSNNRYTEECRVEAVRQAVAKGHSVAEVDSRLGITTHRFYAWRKKYEPDSVKHQSRSIEQAKIRQLKKELKRVTEERDILNDFRWEPMPLENL